MSFEMPPGSEFPDLVKAGLGKKFDDFIKGILNDDKEFFQIAQDKKEELRNQKAIDLKSFTLSQAGALERGNSNSCESKSKFETIAAKQSQQVKPIELPGSKSRSPLLDKKKLTKMPKTRSSMPTAGARSRPSSINRFKVNKGLTPAISDRSHFIQPIDTDKSVQKSKRNASQFVKAHSSERGTSIGDRAVVFSANGTPHYGDSYLDKNAAENLAANQATSNAPVSQIPKKLEQGKPISANPLQQQPRANVAPKADTTANLVVLGGIAAAITAILFLFQHVLIFVQMILQVSSVTSTVTNIAGSFVAILNNLGSLFGLGEGLIDPLSKTFDSILNNVFGKEKVDYVKFQFAKISSAYVAGQNLLSKIGNFNNSIGKVTEDNANNTSKIGNALKAMGMMASGESWMKEDNKVATGTAKFSSTLGSISGLASTLSDISNDVKSAKEEQDSLDKAQEDKLKQTKESEDKAIEKNEDKVVEDADRVREAIK
jgi:hypothetical protein